MSLTTFSLTSPTTGATIKSWGAAVSAAILGAGLVKASDTGQVDWVGGTFTFPAGTSNVEIGYEMWKFNDALQPTKPVFVRVGYQQTAASGVGGFYLSIVVGTATNGTGTVTGVVSNTLWLSPDTGSIPFVGTVSCFSSGDGSSLVLTLGYLASSNNTKSGLGVFYVDRTRDSVGAITGEGCVTGITGYGTANSPSSNFGGSTDSGLCQILQFTVATVITLGSTNTNTAVTLPGYVPGSMSNGTTIGFSAPALICNGKLLPPILAAVSYFTTDILSGTQITLSLSGANHTYMCLGAFAAGGDRLPGQTNAALAVRYE